ncbi:MAG: HAMP domain-containing protein [Chitinophagaceae bacterium]|nr:HAMP domain-containing protein [Chitinophagaceae bacterium]
MRLKTKLSIGIGFLFIVILIFGILGLVSINQLKNNSRLILQNNYETLVYSNNMMKALDKSADTSFLRIFEENLNLQENNITEPGEKEATLAARRNFQALQVQPLNDSLKRAIRENIQVVNELNQQAIFGKNKTAESTAETASTWLLVTFSVLALIAFTLTVNFPGVISEPVAALSEGIAAIANKDYSKRIHLKQKDEFGDLANTFNSMAEKLDEYEHSNLAKIKFEKSRIETIINQMKDGIIGLDEKRNVLFINEVGQNLLGLKEYEIAGKYVADIALKNDLMRTLLQDELKKDLKIYADGKESYFNKDILNVINGGEVVGQVIILRNITPFHELNEAKTNFIATVSHELKTPISSIKMSLLLLEKQTTGDINSEQKQLIESIKEDSNRLLKITGELLNLSQVETGNIQLSIQQSDPYKILDYALEAVKVTAEQKGVSLKIAAETGLPQVKADLEKTAWVLVNLLTNAIRYSPENNEVQIEVKRKDNAILFAVKDVGKGIEAKYKDKIFNRYFQVPGSSKSGTGLGLSISKEFIEAQGGSIGVESEIGSGSRFYFELST